MFYRINSGTGWGSEQSVGGTGWSANSIKQIASDTVNPFIVNGTATAYVAYVTGGTSGSIKAASFYGNGTFKAIELADGSLVHRQPSLTVTGGQVLHVYSFVNGVIYDTQRNETSWQSPNIPYGEDYDSPDQLTAQVSGTFNTGVLWRSGSYSPYTLNYGGVQSNDIATNGQRISVGTNSYYEGEKRLVTTKSALFAFWYDQSHIKYAYSKDRGYTWTIPSSGQPQTGKIANDYTRWTVGATKISSTNYIYLLYSKQSGNTIELWAKRGTVSETGTSISWSTAKSLLKITNGEFVGAVASKDLDGSNVYAAFSWKDPSSLNWKYRIFKAASGSTTWTNSTGTSNQDSGSKFRISMALTPLAGTKMLLAYFKYDSPNVFYRVLSGSTWGGTSSYSSTGFTSNVYKQVSAASDSTGKPYFAYVGATSAYDDDLKVVTWTTSGTSPSAKTADSDERSGLGHRLPSLIVSAGDHLHIYFVAKTNIFETNNRLHVTSELRNGGTTLWSDPYKPYGEAIVDQLTVSINLNNTYTDALWTEGINPYTIMSGGFLPWYVILFCVDHFASLADDCSGQESHPTYYPQPFTYVTPWATQSSISCLPPSAPYSCQVVDYVFGHPQRTFWFELTATFPFLRLFQYTDQGGEHMAQFVTAFNPPWRDVHSLSTPIPACEDREGCLDGVLLDGVPNQSLTANNDATVYRSATGNVVIVINVHWLILGYKNP